MRRDVGASGLVLALEGAWAAIRAQHPDVPEAIIVVASGTSGRSAKLGHYAASRWEVAGAQTAEVLVAGEGLRRGVDDVLTTLLHEAAHGVAHVRQLSDTSRGGRYHNRRYAALATELGLVATQDVRFGWAMTSLAIGTRDRFVRPLTAIEAALLLWRRAEASAGVTAAGAALVACACPCGRKLRASRSVVDEAPIICGRCDAAFTAIATNTALTRARQARGWGVPASRGSPEQLGEDRRG